MDILRKTIFSKQVLVMCFLAGYLLRGIIYHFIPVVNEVFTWLFPIWTAVVVIYETVHRKILDDPAEKVLALFIGAVILSLAVNFIPADMDTVVSVTQLILLTLLVFTALKNDAEADSFYQKAAFTAWAVIIFLGFISSVAYLTYRAGITLPFGLNSASRIFTYGHLGNDERFCGYFGYSTDGGNLSALCLVLSVWLMKTKKLPVFAGVISCMICLLMICALDVRTSMIEVMIVVFSACYFQVRKRLSAGRTVLSMAALLVILAAAVYVLKTDKILSIAAQLREDPVTTLRFLSTGRTVYWTQAFEAFLQKPLFGWGWLNSSQLTFFDAHNIIFNLMLWTGAAGTVLFILFAVLLIRKLVINRNIISEKQLGWLTVLLICVLAEAMLDRCIAGTANTGPETIMFWLTSGYLYYLK